VRYAYKQLVVPHLDMDLAAKVMDASKSEQQPKQKRARRDGSVGPVFEK
jgi:hypothetical protein